jgi:hypothetical protein
VVAQELDLRNRAPRCAGRATTVVRNGLGVVTRDGDWHVVVEDPREDALATFLDRLEAGTAVPDDLLAAAGPRLQFPTSVSKQSEPLLAVPWRRRGREDPGPSWCAPVRR